MSEYRREKAINQMLEYLKHVKMAQEAAESFRELALLSEVYCPEKVRDISLDKLCCKIQTAEYVGHIACFCEIEVNLHTALSGSNPQEKIFKAVFDEFKSKGGLK